MDGWMDGWIRGRGRGRGEEQKKMSPLNNKYYSNILLKT